MNPLAAPRLILGLLSSAVLLLAGCAGPSEGGDEMAGPAYMPSGAGALGPMANPLLPDGFVTYEPAAVMRPPSLVVQARPQYPFELRRDGVSGSAVVDFIVDEYGMPRNITAVRATRPEFAQSAVSCVAHWRYRPGLVQGRPVRVHLQVPMYYSLNNDR